MIPIMATSTYMQNTTDQFMNGLMDIVGNPMLIGLLLLIFFVFFIIALRISFDIAIVSFIPIMFIVSVFVEPLRLIFLIVLGLLIGIGVLRLIGKR